MNLQLKEIFRQSILLLYRNSKFVWLFWGTNLAFGIVLSLPIYYMLSDQLLHSAMSDKLNFGLDYIWFLQFLSLYKTEIGEIPYIIYGTAGIYVLIQVFYLGGLISVFNIVKKNEYVDFFYGGVKYWYRFTKVFLLSIIFFALAFKANDLLGQFISHMFENQEKIIFEFILRASRYILLIFLIGLVTLVGDYIKISLAVKDSNKVLKEIYPTLVFLKDNFNRVFTVFFLVAVLGALGAVIYNILDGFLPKTHYFYLLLAFILQQMLIIFRLLVRMLFSATEVYLFKDINAQIVLTQAEEVE
ncbi:MAG: hypothetical protein ACM34K_02135 [Bacillota bacterium]